MTFATAAAGNRTGARDHIVDVLIAERAPRLSGSPAWPLLRPLLYALLDYAKARRMADAIAPMPGRAALDHVSDLLALDVRATGLDRVPAEGRVVVICNHPTGIADGVAVFDALKRLRPDICFYANADAHRVVPQFGEVLIPVEWVESKRTRDRTRLTLQLTKAALDAGRCLVIFPAGRLARRAADGRLADPTWMSSAISIARRHEAPVVPMHVAGPWSTLFHLFHGRSDELRDITLFHELLNKRGRAFSLTAGPLIPPVALEGDPVRVTERLKAYVEHTLPADPARPFA
ncbi:MAG: 1-acyl-sn-glycerol-3-phosphate acyltransferase [Phenylobacterium sp.]|uniref:1-acyl-sn-glycerol-3-phosphate acyltransferase n=1 Tax=Phenylobacterium sp. TaxID=1871053 RepID=UPI001A544DE7|nr:1-acyl-sn-glycerol-3-phosphate acyltransferase [Phenylobacterium sp.]MBL8770491.1 1-acyl-sn-glycerol-3-phosphate acyltransferase [Phenylobacterium sp.]